MAEPQRDTKTKSATGSLDGAEAPALDEIMDRVAERQVSAPTSSPYVSFSQQEWSRLRAGTPLTLDEDELEVLRGINEQVSLDEVVNIYLPLSRLLNLYVAASQELFSVTGRFLGKSEPKVPYVIGVAGSVAVGKSTTSRILRALLSRWPNHPKVDLVTTDGFLLPNQVLQERGIMDRKGFPESYDVRRLLRFVLRVKSGERAVPHPLYSHNTYDILAGEERIVDQPDILIVEGLNVLQTNSIGQRSGAEEGPKSLRFLSDLFDFSVYVDAAAAVIEQWYVDRFLTLQRTAFRDPSAFFHRYSHLSKAEAVATAEDIWRRINKPNLIENIAPTRDRATLILEKGADHSVERVNLRKL